MDTSIKRRRMPKTEYIDYHGRRYFLQSTGKYFNCGYYKCEGLLHRAIWAEHHGPIPEGMDVHHRNDDWRDNRIENLELMEHAAHNRMHTQRLYDTSPAFRESALIGMRKAVEARKVWAKTDEGKRSMAETNRKAWITKRANPSEGKCPVCGTLFPVYGGHLKISCSRRCKSRKNYLIARYGHFATVT